MEHIEIDDPLPAPIVQVLLALTEVAERNQVLDVQWTEAPGEQYGTYNLILSSGKDRLRLTVHSQTMQSLERLGLIELDNNAVFLCPATFKRAKYERKNWIGQWIARAVHKWRDVLVILSFLFSTVATVISVISLLARTNPPHP